MRFEDSSKLSTSKESYIETIYHLIKEEGYARVADIAETLDVKPPSVTGMIQKLDEEKYVTYKKYRGVILTKKGLSLAKKLESKHHALRDFLLMIGVSEENAEKDACEIEHEINPETVEKLTKFVNFVQSAPEVPTFLKHFKQFCITGKRPNSCKIKSKKLLISKDKDT